MLEMKNVQQQQQLVFYLREHPGGGSMHYGKNKLGEMAWSIQEPE